MCGEKGEIRGDRGAKDLGNIDKEVREREGRKGRAGAVPLAAGIDHRWLARQRVLLCTAEERKKGRTKGEAQ